MASAMDLFTDVLRMLDLERGRHRQAPHYLQFNILEVHNRWGENSIREKYRRLFVAPERNRNESYYLQAIRQVSHDIDWFITRLTRRPGWEDTLVVLVSDHGEGMNSHPDVARSVNHGHLLYQSQVSVPWILYSTAGRLPEGLVVERPVRLLDLMPTVLELCGIKAPNPMRGQSLVPLLNNQEVQLPEAFVVETEFRESEKLGVYSENWEYFENRDDHPGLNRRELQRFGSTENGKETDQADLHPEVVERLATYLEQWERDNPKMTPTLPDRELSPEEVHQLRSLGYIQ
jgi:arylsulfatase A-like enzyme